jgi:hypothetical protein
LPILFNLIVDMLAILINRSKELGHFSRVIPHLVDGDLSILQYADDTIIFLENDHQGAKNMKLLLCAFEQLSGLKMNFHKSELFCYGSLKEFEEEYSQIFGCGTVSFPFRYLGIPLHHRKLRNSDWKEVEERFQKKLSSCKGKMLSTGGRVVLINSIVGSLSIFTLSFFEVPRKILKKLDYYRSRFFWQSGGHKKEYRLTRWDVICAPKDQGGLGILDLDLQNRCLLSKRLFKLINEDGMWQSILLKKYMRHRTITQVEYMSGDSFLVWTYES